MQSIAGSCTRYGAVAIRARWSYRFPTVAGSAHFLAAESAEDYFVHHPTRVSVFRTEEWWPNVASTVVQAHPWHVYYQNRPWYYIPLCHAVGSATQ